MNEAPDFVEPFEAWRVWRVVRGEGEYGLRHDGEYRLGSVVQRTHWPAGEPLTAQCLGRRGLVPRLRRKHRHDAPEPDCECGIYAAALELVGQYVAEAPCRGNARVLGRVALWGTVIECERGFRASHAYPTRIYVPTDAGDPWRVSWEEVALGLCRYRGPDRSTRDPRHRSYAPPRRTTSRLNNAERAQKPPRKRERRSRAESARVGPDETGGLRLIAEQTGTQTNLQLSVVPLPAEDDEVVEEQGARVVLEPGAASLLDDKVLDASVEQDQVAFTVADRIEE